MTAEEIIAKLGLIPLPGEGGYYRETYRSPLSVPIGAGKTRPASTCIYYLLTPQTYSALHRLQFDEIYHFYLGDPILMTLFDESAPPRTIQLGSGFANASVPQMVVPAHTWQGSRLAPGGKWGLVGCTLGPGFDFADCELATERWLERFPTHAEELGPLLPGVAISHHD